MTRIKICPKCKKPTLKNAVNVSGWLAPNMFECTSCKYIGPLFLEIDPKDLEEKNSSNNDYSD
ncbi:MAG: hypothetical protein EAX91_13950 [Candidatus Lokiarchaeota archaeon]|nr:hypothetical protein [Candidatus Lokiarchaeota archaeon]